MGLLKEINFHFSCDMKSCSVSGKGAELPDGWHLLSLNLRATAIGDVSVVRAFICPACSEWLTRQVHNQKKLTPNG